MNILINFKQSLEQISVGLYQNYANQVKNDKTYHVVRKFFKF